MHISHINIRRLKYPVICLCYFSGSLFLIPCCKELRVRAAKKTAGSHTANGATRKYPCICWYTATHTHTHICLQYLKKCVCCFCSLEMRSSQHQTFRVKCSCYAAIKPIKLRPWYDASTIASSSAWKPQFVTCVSMSYAGKIKWNLLVSLVSTGSAE